MTDGDALLAAILANPAEDTPRLVYADWLEENRQPERAEFIRVQVELAATQYGGIQKGQFDELKAREHELWFLQCARRWFDVSDIFGLSGWLRREPGRVSWSGPECWAATRRGFLSHITCTAADWLKYEYALLKRHPIERVTLTSREGLDYRCSWLVTEEYMKLKWPGIEIEWPDNTEYLRPDFEPLFTPPFPVSS